jgi:glucose-6-phosphate 1-dehydrogenase
MKSKNQLEPTIFVIFGGAGDLTWRKLVPSLFDLSIAQSLPRFFSILVIDRTALEENAFRQHLREGVVKFSRKGSVKAQEWNQFAKHIHYLQGDFKKSQTYTAIFHHCANLDKEWDVKANTVFYMATPPSLFGVIPKYLHEAGLNRNEEKSRIVVEKPIGYNLESAQELNRILTTYFTESQIFRIDHYLGKETVQNMLAFRFANPLFEPIWNRHYVSYVAITVAEDIGVEHRGGYYDSAGALRDMVQNHLIQLLCLIAMEPMVSFEGNEIRNKKIDVLHAIRPILPEMINQCAVRGQYSRGWVNGKEVCGYAEEEGVAPDSQTETFVALKLFVDNWRWQDVPFYLRTGKRLPGQASEVAIQFRPVPHQSFPPEATLDWQPSRLVMSIQPGEGIVLCFQAKHPGPKMHLRAVNMRFNYEETFLKPSSDAYETLLWDIMNKDVTLFMRSDQVEAAWKLLMPVIDMWKMAPPSDFPNYEAGSWGPPASNWLLAQQGHSWPIPIDLCGPRKTKGKKS